MASKLGSCMVSVLVALALSSMVVSSQGDTQAMSKYREPSSLFFRLISEFFDDIDWPAIDHARDQIEKIIYRMREVWSRLHGAGASNTTSQESHGRFFGSGANWWSKVYPGASKSAPDDSTNVKEMLERVACFVGYVRLMNLSQEALAELDASKVLSSLFSGGAKQGGMLSSLFG